MSIDLLRATDTELFVSAPAVSGGRVVLGPTVSASDKMVYPSVVTNITTAGAATYTAAQLLGGIITRDPNGAIRTDVTATAAEIIAAAPGLKDNEFFKCYYINTGAFTVTMSAGAGVTISNVGQTIAQNESAIFLFRRTSSTAVTMYIIGA